MKPYKIDQYFEYHFQTQRFDTGVATDADALPTYRVYEENNDTVIDSGNCSKVDDANTTGYYKARSQCTTALGYEVGKSYEVRVSATVNSVVGASVVGRVSIVPALVWDSLYGGTDNLQVDTVQVGGTTQSAGDLKALIDAIQADLGDASASTLGSIYAILGNAAATLTSRVPSGTPGATDGAHILGTNAAKPTYTEGIKISSSTGHTLELENTASSYPNNAIHITATYGKGLYAYTSSTPLYLECTGGGYGMEITGGITGCSIYGSLYGLILNGATQDLSLVNSKSQLFTHATYGLDKLVRATTPANKLDISATGEAGLDFSNIKQAVAPTTLTNITVPTVTSITNAPTDMALNSTVAKEATAQSILTDTNELQTDWVNGGRLDLLLDAVAKEATLSTVAGYVDNEIQTLLDRLTAARAGYLDQLNVAGSGTTSLYIKKMMIDLVNKKQITELNGNTEQFDDSDVSIGTITAAYSTAAGVRIRKRMVI